MMKCTVVRIVCMERTQAYLELCGKLRRDRSGWSWSLSSFPSQLLSKEAGQSSSQKPRPWPTGTSLNKIKPVVMCHTVRQKVSVTIHCHPKDSGLWPFSMATGMSGLSCPLCELRRYQKLCAFATFHLISWRPLSVDTFKWTLLFYL